MALAMSTAGLIQADPSDDFSLTLHGTQSNSFKTLSERRVSEILEDRLDSFPRSEAPHLARHLLSLCREYRFDPSFVLALIEVESRFQIRALSPAGAVGLMQLMPGTALKVFHTESRFKTAQGLKKYAPLRGKISRRLEDPYFNIEIGIAYLASLRDRYRDHSPYYLVAAYNVGPAKMDDLLSRKAFKPVNTRRYYNAIRRAIPEFRSYRRMGAPKKTEE